MFLLALEKGFMQALSESKIDNKVLLRWIIDDPAFYNALLLQVKALCVQRLLKTTDISEIEKYVRVLKSFHVITALKKGKKGEKEEDEPSTWEGMVRGEEGKE